MANRHCFRPSNIQITNFVRGTELRHTKLSFNCSIVQYPPCLGMMYDRAIEVQHRSVWGGFCYEVGDMPELDVMNKMGVQRYESSTNV